MRIGIVIAAGIGGRGKIINLNGQIICDSYVGIGKSVGIIINIIVKPVIWRPEQFVFGFTDQRRNTIDIVIIFNKGHKRKRRLIRDIISDDYVSQLVEVRVYIFTGIGWKGCSVKYLDFIRLICDIYKPGLNVCGKPYHI